MSIIFRFAERGDGGAGGPTTSGSPVIDLGKHSLQVQIHTAKYGRPTIQQNSPSGPGYISVMVTGGLGSLAA